MRVKICLFLILQIVFCSNMFAEDWTGTLRSHFDIVDTFDSCADWTGDAPDNGCEEYAWGVGWGYHCYYERDQNICTHPRPTVLTNHGTDKIVTGKSVRLSHSGMGGLDCGECSTVRHYSGTGTQKSGFMDMYLFIRVYFPKTLFPTWAYDDTNHTKKCYDEPNNPDPVVCHVQGKEYCDTDSWKWISTSLGYVDANHWSSLSIRSNPCRYGANESHYYIAGGASQNYEKRIVYYSPETMTTTWGAVDITPYFDKLIGVEFHVRRESSIGANDGLMEAWFYDEDGIATKVIERTNFQFINPNSSCIQSLSSEVKNNLVLDDMAFNRVMIESNKRLVSTLNYNAGNLYDNQGNKIGVMEAVWYMDDFIVNGTRIGPTYYQLIGSQGKLKPKETKATIIN